MDDHTIDYRESVIGDGLFLGSGNSRADGPDGVAWEPSIDAALARSERENKLLFVQFAAKFDGRSNSPYS